jgi:hypothetical protein
MYVQYARVEPDNQITGVIRQLASKPAPTEDEDWRVVPEDFELGTRLQNAPEKFFWHGDRPFEKVQISLRADPWEAPVGPYAVEVWAEDERGERIEVAVTVGFQEPIAARTPFKLGWGVEADVEISLAEPHMWCKDNPLIRFREAT